MICSLILLRAVKMQLEKKRKEKTSYKQETKGSKLTKNVAYFTLNPNVHFQDSYREPVKCIQGKTG